MTVALRRLDFNQSQPDLLKNRHSRRVNICMLHLLAELIAPTDLIAGKCSRMRVLSAHIIFTCYRLQVTPASVGIDMRACHGWAHPSSRRVRYEVQLTLASLGKLELDVHSLILLVSL